MRRSNTFIVRESNIEIAVSHLLCDTEQVSFSSKSYPMYEIGTLSVCAHQDFSLFSSSRHNDLLAVIHGHLTFWLIQAEMARVSMRL